MVEEGPGGIHSLGQEEQVQFRRFQFELRLKDLLLKNLTGRHVGRLRKESVDPIPPHIEIQEVLALKSSVLLGAIENGFKRRYKKLSKNKKTRGIEIRE
ncbi:MAG TPA: hypothetical protein VMU70_01075, partial [Candidatus Tyrphobacter sp.]|nr:hypothetical protein [Candidatus Tyrphobacter sp.]